MKTAYRYAIASVLALAICALVLLLLQRTGRPNSLETAASLPPLALAVTAAPSTATTAATATAAPTVTSPTATPSPCELLECITPPPGTPISLTPTPYILPTPLPTDTVLSDPAGTFRMTVPAGWFAYLPPQPQSIAEWDTVFSNVVIDSGQPLPADTIVVHLSMGHLPPGVTFDQWVAERRAYNLNPPVGAAASSISDSLPITIASYSGITYTSRRSADKPEDEVQSIYLNGDNRWVIQVVIEPTSSPYYQQAKTMVESLSLTLP